jgi:flagellar basal body-associated protein FliL
MAQEAESQQQEGGRSKRGIGGMLVPILLVLVLVALVFVIMTLRKLPAPSAEGHEGEAKPAAASTKMVQIPVCENLTTTNRLQQAVQCTVILQIRDDEKGERGKKWQEPESLALLKSMVIDVIQNIDFVSPRPQPKDLFEAEVRRRVDQLIGEEGAVDRVLVTQWLVMPR